ncbi:MAG: hypothetical protein KatS3mg051_2077 [Anaerolineae bacterium]|nr:MAG: hypothetical protein KatS3mg051_2077 [Anaerolineae bacterium]
MTTLIPLDAITDSPYQARRSYDEAAIRELADSIAQHPARGRTRLTFARKHWPNRPWY